MKKIYITAFLLFTLLPFQSIFAQNAPGLLGKRWTIMYNLDFFYNLQHTAYNQAIRDLPEEPATFLDAAVISITNPGFAFVHQHNIQMEYARSRFTSVGLGLSYFRNGHGMVRNNNDVYAASKNFVVTGGSLIIKKFLSNKGGIAPLGTYYQYGLHLNRVRSSLNVHATIPSNIEEEEDVVSLRPAVSVAYGRQFLLGKALMNVGAEGMLLYPSDDNYIERLTLAYSFRFKVGVGLVAF